MKLKFEIKQFHTRPSLQYDHSATNNIPYIFKETGKLWFIWDIIVDNMEEKRRKSYRYILKRLA